jgi:TetR/AcrR family transcriptional regulator, copper-responsive repressor
MQDNMANRGRGRPRSFDLNAALESAMLVFWDRGYEATSVDDLAQAMGISPSSLYVTFGSKERLFLAAVDRYLAGPGGLMVEILDQAPTTKQAFERLFEAAAREMTRDDRPRGCMVAIGATHCSPDALPVRDALRAHRERSLQVLEARIRRGVDAGELPTDTDTAGLAVFLTSAIQGMSVQSRDGASRETLLGIGRAAMRAWPPTLSKQRK